MRTDAIGNILIIVDDTPGSGGSGRSPIPPSILIVPPLSISPEKSVVTPPQKTLPKTPKNIIKQITPNSLESEYAEYLKLKKRLSALIDEENIAGMKGIINPKTLPQTGKSILARVKKLINMKLSLEAPEFKK